MQFVVQRGFIIVMVNIFEAKMFACEIHVKFFDRFALQHLIHVNMFTFSEHFALDQCIAEAGSQMLTQHAVQIWLLDAFAA